MDAGDRFYTPDLLWENYNLMYENAFGGKFYPFPTFTENGGFNVAGLRGQLTTGPIGKRILSLNFPNNPTGYTVTSAEAQEIRAVVLAAAHAGNNVVVIIDDAYFGLVYEPGILTESIFPLLANLHERVLAIKIDGATKEDYVWGFRVGFITYGIKGATPAVYAALEAKTAGAIRGNISNSPNISQALLNKAYNSPDYEKQKQQKFATLKRRYDKVKAIFAEHPEYAEVWTPLPFNSGYFMCLKPKKADPEKVRKLLLNDFSTGVIVVDNVIRVAFSSTPYDQLETLYANIYQAMVRVEKGN
jgi:aspartate/methionine/tyrosine aminotransferase